MTEYTSSLVGNRTPKFKQKSILFILLYSSLNEIKKIKISKVKDFLLKAKIRKQEEENSKPKVDTPGGPNTTKNKSHLDLLRSR